MPAGIRGDGYWVDGAALQGRREGVRRMRARSDQVTPPRPTALRGLLLACVFAVLAPTAAQATLLPAGFFDAPVDLAKGAVGVEADRLDYDRPHSSITAAGNVHFTDGGYSISADQLTYE